MNSRSSTCMDAYRCPRWAIIAFSCHYDHTCTRESIIEGFYGTSSRSLIRGKIEFLFFLIWDV